MKNMNSSQNYCQPSNFSTIKKYISKKFDMYEMDKNWQRLGRITSENLQTFLATSNAKIVLKNPKKGTFYKYTFKKNSQISIKRKHLMFQIKDVIRFLVKPIEK